jgi:hypothetical protein
MVLGGSALGVRVENSYRNRRHFGRLANLINSINLVCRFSNDALLICLQYFHDVPIIHVP